MGTHLPEWTLGASLCIWSYEDVECRIYEVSIGVHVKLQLEINRNSFYFILSRGRTVADRKIMTERASITVHRMVF